MTTTTITNLDNEKMTITLNDEVGFKYDFEREGRIDEIETCNGRIILWIDCEGEMFEVPARKIWAV